MITPMDTVFSVLKQWGTEDDDYDVVVEAIRELDEPDVLEWRGNTLGLRDVLTTIKLRHFSTGATQFWEVHCKNTVNHEIHLGVGADLELVDASPVLWPHDEPEVDLYFEKKGETSVAAVAGALYARHREVAGDLLRFSDFTNNHRPLLLLLGTNPGLLGRGPAPLMDAYARVLEENGYETSILPLGSKPGKHRALILGPSFVVAEEFFPHASGGGTEPTV